MNASTVDVGVMLRKTALRRVPRKPRYSVLLMYKARAHVAGMLGKKYGGLTSRWQTDV